MKSDVLQRLFDRMDKDPWHVKLRRKIRLKYWIFKCSLRKYFDKEYIAFMSAKYGKGWRNIHGA